MKRIFFLTIIFLLFPAITHGATEFVSVVDTGGAGDYSSLSLWETAIDSDLTSASNKVFGGTKTGTIADGASVTGSISLATGTVYHATATQIYLIVLTGTFQSAEQIQVDGSNYFTTTDAGDSAIAIAKCRATTGAADTTAVTITDWTTSADNYIKIWTDPSENYRHNGKWDEGKYRLETPNGMAWSVNIQEDYVTIDGLQILKTNTQYDGYGTINVPTTLSGETKISNNILKVNNQTIYNMSGIAIDNTSALTTQTVKIWNNIIYDFRDTDNNDCNAIVINTLATSTGAAYVYNNSIYNSTVGIYLSNGIPVTLKNNLIKNSNDGYGVVAGSYPNATYNLTNTSASDGAFGVAADSGTTDGVAANKLIQSGQNFNTTVKVGMIVKNTTDTTYSYVTAVDSNIQLSIADDIMVSGENYTVYTNMYGNATFTDETNKDFHLDSSDTAARNQGIILYDAGDDANLNFTTDVDNNARLDSAGTWDIGADEAITKVYRSVGPFAATALAVGGTYGNVEVKVAYLSGSTTNIIDYVATFWSDLPTNVGVGDALQYDDDDNGTIDASDSIVFITKRIDASHFSVRTASGAAPASTLAPDSDWSIFRAYTSLATAESIDANADENNFIDDDLENFDNWTAGRDIVANQEQWNMVCYANSTTADTAAVVINGWTTSADSFIKIYTPTRSDETGITQRHLGIFSASYYGLIMPVAGIPLTVSDEYVRIEGLQFYSADNDGVYVNGATGTSHFQFSQNIIKGNATASKRGINLASTGSSSIAKIYNNIIYDYTASGTGTGIYWNDADWTPYAYNNTIKDCAIGLDRGNDTAHYTKNNLIDATDAFNGTFTDNDTNNNYNSILENNAGEVAIGTNGKYNQSFVYNDSANDDFHLGVGDAGARNFGTDLSNDLYLPFNTDIDSVCYRRDAINRVSTGGDEQCYNRPRGTTWDIGADELITKIYRSVAPDADGSMPAIDNDNSQADTLSIATTGIATFEVAVTDIVGVGDALIWDDDGDNDLDVDDTILFIHSRTDSTHYTVRDADGSLPDVATTDNDKWALYRAYTSLSNAEAGTKNTAIPITFSGGDRDIATNSEQWNVACYANSTTADTTAVTVTGWTTAPQNYIKIFTPTLTSEVGTSQRHQGKWDDTKYRLDYTATGNYKPIFDVQENYVRIDGLQMDYNDGNYTDTVEAVWIRGDSASNEVQVSNCILKQTGGTGNGYGILAQYSGQVIKIWNNIVYDFRMGGIYPQSAASKYLYNNTAYGCGAYGIYASGAVATNNLSFNNTIGGFYGGEYAVSGSNNVSSDASADDSPLTSGQINKVATDLFVDVVNRDFHLKSSDTAARNAGADISQDYWLPITSDIDGQTRATEWLSEPPGGSGVATDIGADESATPIYRSIAPSKTDALATGTGNNLTISGTTATFASTVEGTNAIGVGDAIQYDSDGNDSIDAIAFISARASSTSFTVQSRDGANPVVVTNDQNWSIFRAYTTLDNAEGGVENTANIDDDVDDFDISVSRNDGKDIYTSNEQWNIAAYANGVTADTVAVTIEGWTTAPQNYIKIYTPYLTSEVGTSQRHSGKWDDGKYRLEITRSTGGGGTYISINNREDYVRVDGIQLKTIYTASDGYIYGFYIAGQTLNNSDVRISNSIFSGVNSGIPASFMGIYSIGEVIGSLWNNIIYNFENGIYLLAGSISLPRYIYNSTIYNCSVLGIRTGSTASVIAKNNISYNNTTDYSGTFNSASTNNLSKDATAPGAGACPGANCYYRSKTLSFLNTASGAEDFHLALTDADAKDAGTSLCADSYLPFSTDIDGNSRPCGSSIWDIGADEVVQAMIEIKRNVNFGRNVNFMGK